MPDRPEIKYKTGRPHLEAVCDALRSTNGLVEPAARLLQMDGGNLRKYIRTHAKCQAVKIEAREKIKDLAEAQLVQLLNAKDWRAVQFVLLTLGKDRGYSLAKGAALGDGVNNTIMIDKVTITRWRAARSSVKRIRSRARASPARWFTIVRPRS
jgi:hypothetical protein